MSGAAKLIRFCAVVVLALVPVACLGQAAPNQKLPLRVLYAGKPGSAREADFTRFLQQYFREVTTGDLAAFKPGDAHNSDVVVLDYDGDGFKAPRPQLPDSYARPTVTVGVAGGLLCSSLRLKTGYL